MANSTTTFPAIEFSGKKAEKELAQLAFDLYRARGAFFAASAPIRLSLSSLVDALASTGHDTTEAKLAAALNANPHVWARDETEDEVLYITTRRGTPPVTQADETDDHTLAERFTTPEPARARPKSRDVFAGESDSSLTDSSSSTIEFPADSWQAAVAAALREAGQPATDVVISESGRRHRRTGRHRFSACRRRAVTAG